MSKEVQEDDEDAKNVYPVWQKKHRMFAFFVHSLNGSRRNMELGPEVTTCVTNDQLELRDPAFHEKMTRPSESIYAEIVAPGLCFRVFAFGLGFPISVCLSVCLHACLPACLYVPCLILQGNSGDHKLKTYQCIPSF